MISQDAHLFLLEDEGVVFAERSQALYELNAAAALIWCSLEEGESPAQAAKRLTKRANLADDVAHSYVTALMADWERLGLLQGSEPSEKPSGPREAEEDDLFLGDASSFCVGSAPKSACAYRVMGTDTAVNFGSAVQKDVVHRSLAHLEVPNAARSYHRIDIIPGDRGHLILKDEKAVYICRSADRILPVIIEIMVTMAMNASRYFLQIHAGSVSNGQASLLFPAAPTSGKSTLVSGLMLAGFQFRSDEYAILDEPDMRLRTAAIPACLKEGAWPVIGASYPELADATTHLRADGKSVRYLPTRHWHKDGDAAEPVAAIIFPRYAHGVATTLTPMARARALRLFMEQCLTIPEWFDRYKVGRIVKWLKATPCFALELSDLPTAVDLIRARWGPV